MLALLQTLFDIIRLKKGPDAIPYSAFVFGVVVALWLMAGVVAMIATPGFTDRDLVVTTGTGVMVLVLYIVIITVAGHRPRVLQTLSSVLGCGAIMTFFVVASDAIVGPLLGDEVAQAVTLLILIWSILVEGHILARAIERQLIFGFLVAMSAFMFQYFLYVMLTPQAATIA